MKQTPVILSDLDKLHIKLGDSNALIGVCPSFKINPITLDIPLHTIQYSEDKIIGCFETFEAKKIAALCGIGFLKFDFQFLNSIHIVGDDHKQIPIEDLEIASKRYARNLEMKWFDSQKKLQPYKKDFFFTSDLLDNSVCKLMYEKLHAYCESKAGTKLVDALKFQYSRFVANNFKEMLARKDIAALDGSQSVEEVLDKHMVQYIQFEFATFAFFASQGWNVFMYPNADRALRKTIGMAISVLTKAQISPLLTKSTTMQAVSIGFDKKEEKKSERKEDDLIYFSGKKHTKKEIEVELLIKEIIESNLAVEVKASLIQTAIKSYKPSVNESSVNISGAAFNIAAVIGLGFFASRLINFAGSEIYSSFRL